MKFCGVFCQSSVPGRSAKVVLFSFSHVLLLLTAAAAPLRRVENTTLAVPQDPYRFAVVDAFPGLTFQSPVAIVSPPGETNRLFVVEKWGAIQVITNLTQPAKTLFCYVPVNFSGEGGLVGMAFHPGYRTNRYFYLFYTLDTVSEAGFGLHDRLARYEISAEDPNQARADSEVPLITQFDEADDHNAGDLSFGPDGYLYVSLGDEGCCGDEFQNSQRIDKDFFSAILRIDVDLRPDSIPPNPHPAASTNYTIPADNPFIGATNFNGQSVDPAAVRTEFWAVGFRNPWRFSFDRLTGRLYCGDVGQDGREEVNVIVKGGNYGWNYREGLEPYNEPAPAESTFVDPVLDYPHDYGPLEGRAVIGGVVYRGNRLPQLYDNYIFGDFVLGHIWAAQHDGTRLVNFRRLTGLSLISAFGTDPSNDDILIARLNDFEEKLYRLVDREDAADSLPPSLAETGAFQDLASLTPHAGIVPYDINVSFWSDHALKRRWFSVPDTNLMLGFTSHGNWSFPTGTVWIKHFDLELTNGVPGSARRLETRFLVRNANGVHGFTYRWDDLQQNAMLVPEEGMDASFTIYDGGTIRTQQWHYPARGECSACHTPHGGLALGFNTAQMNRNFNYEGGPANQLAALAEAGYLDDPLPALETLPVLAEATNAAFSVEHRVRSYFAANCVQCHQPGGSAPGLWDARFATPMARAGIVNGAVLKDFGDAQNRVARPGSLEHSVLFQRVANLGPAHMPPLATSELNLQAINLLSGWITNDLVARYTPVIRSIRSDAGELRLSFSGEKEQVYQLEASMDLQHWGLQGNVKTDAEGTATYRELLDTSARRFFRVKF